MERVMKVALAVGVLAMVPVPAAFAEEAPYEAHGVIVQYTDGASPGARARVDRAAGVEERVAPVKGADAQLVRVRGDARSAAAALNRSASVLYAEPNYIMQAEAIPNDPRFGELYGINNTGQGGGTPDADLDGPEGWDLAGLQAFPATGGVKVGIVDTGIDQNHQDLVGKTVNCARVNAFFGSGPTEGSCPDDNNHGTHVAGTIAAIANNGVGVAGVAFNSQLAICKALFGTQGSGTVAGVANCITYLNSRGARVISMSLGGPQSTTLRNAVVNAYRGGGAGGSVLVAAAGNAGNSSVSYPAGYAEVISVAATDRNDQRASFSQFNADVEVAAAGVGVLSTIPGNRYASFSGTSMATPHASGVAALIAYRNPSFTPAQIRERLDSTVDDLGTPLRDNFFGFGRVNLANAMR
jgi:thermitase